MTGEERREQILALLKEGQTPMTGTDLAKRMGVSRQIIVHDIALLRASKQPIIATTKGYII